MSEKIFTHWEGASCLLGEDYEGILYPDHPRTRDKSELTCPICVIAIAQCDQDERRQNNEN